LKWLSCLYYVFSAAALSCPSTLLSLQTNYWALRVTYTIDK
jgi:hypothetical protein